MRLHNAPLLAGTVLVCGVVAIAGRINNTPELYWIFQPLSTALIAWAAWRRGLIADHYAQFITLGLAVCIVADIIRLNEGGALIGLAVLMVAAGLYLTAFTAEARLKLLHWPSVLALALGLLAVTLVFPYANGLGLVAIPASVYLCALLTGQSLSRAFVIPVARRIPARLAAAGACLFVLANLLALIGTLDSSSPVAVWSLVPYWGGLVLLALSVPQRRTETDSVG